MVDETEICNYADDTTIYACGHELEHIVSSLETGAQKFSDWFLGKSMKLNPDKYHLLVLGGKHWRISTYWWDNGNGISWRKILAVTLDKNLESKKHVNILCKRAGQKLHALARISNYMDTEKLRKMMKTFVISQLSYCPLIWMFHDRSAIKKINKTHERALRITYKDSCSTFDELLKKAKSESIHQRNLQLLATEREFKTHSNLNPSFMT